MKEVLGYFKDVDRKFAWISISSVILMCLWIYPGSHRFFRHVIAGPLSTDANIDWYAYSYLHFATLLLFGIIPLLIVKLSFKEKLTDYGLAVGDWRFGLKFLALWIVVMAPLTYANSFQADFLVELSKKKRTSGTHR